MSLQRKCYFWLRAYAFSYLPKAFPAQAVETQLCWVYSGPFTFACLSGVFHSPVAPTSTCQWPHCSSKQPQIRTCSVLLAWPLKHLLVFWDFAFSLRVVPSLLAKMAICGEMLEFRLENSSEATSCFVRCCLIPLGAHFYFIQKKLDGHMDGRMKETCFSPSHVL